MDVVLAKKTVQTFCYAVKLEVEFKVLNRLVRFGRRTQGHLVEFAEQGETGQSDKRLESASHQDQTLAPAGLGRMEIQGTEPRLQSSSVFLPKETLYLPSGSNNLVTSIQDQKEHGLEHIERQYLGRVKDYS
jgi:hypothetical protein